MGFLIVVYGALIVGALVGVIIGVIFRREAAKNYDAAAMGLAKILQCGTPNPDDVRRLFEDHGHQFVKQSGMELIFKPVPLRNWNLDEWLFWSVVLFGSGISFAAVFWFVGRPHEKIAVDCTGFASS